MSNQQDAAIDFADTILQHYPPYRWEDHQEKAWAARLVKELSGFSAEVIRRAADEIVRTRKKPQTPLPAECIEACVGAKRWVDANRNNGKLPIDAGGGQIGHLDWAADRLKLASDLMSTPIGKQAAKEGWAGALWSFARKSARLPQPGAETNGCKDAARGFDEAYASLVRRSNSNPVMRELQEKLEALGAEMLRRRHSIERRVLGSSAP